MDNIVYDTKLIASINTQNTKCRPNSVMAKRLSIVELAVTKKGKPRYNSKLHSEYDMHIKQYRNDLVEAFIIGLVDFGIRVDSNTLPKHIWLKISKAWPGHDKHLIAAAHNCERSFIYTTEVKLGENKEVIYREIGIKVVVL